MATYSGRKSRLPAHMQAFGNQSAFVDQVSVTAALTTSDKVQAIRIPAGTILHGLRFHSGDLDTGTDALRMNVGWESCSGGSITVTDAAGSSSTAASNATAFGSALTDFNTASTVGGSGKTLSFEPISFNDDVYITLIPSVSANAMAAAKTVTTIAEGVTVGIK
jgi:hypothetical protein